MAVDGFDLQANKYPDLILHEFYNYFKNASSSVFNPHLLLRTVHLASIIGKPTGTATATTLTPGTDSGSPANRGTNHPERSCTTNALLCKNALLPFMPLSALASQYCS